MELLFVSSQLASTLRMDLHILPVVASLLIELPADTAAAGRTIGGPAAEVPEAASRMPVLEITDVSASATVHLIGCACNNSAGPRNQHFVLDVTCRMLILETFKPCCKLLWLGARIGRPESGMNKESEMDHEQSL